MNKKLAIYAVAVVIAGCGGGTSSSESMPAALNGVSITGTVATGMAVSGATVTARCAAGAGTATTAIDGSYAMTISAGVLPCVLQATPAGSANAMHSVVAGSASAVRANVTPITELITARLSRGETNELYTNFAPVAAGVTPDSIASAQVDIGAVLASLGTGSNPIDFIGAPLVAASPATAGTRDVHDQLLDLVKAKLAADQYSQVRAALASGSPTATVAQLFAGFARTTVPIEPIPFSTIDDWQTQPSLAFDFSSAQSFIVQNQNAWADIGTHERNHTPLPAVDFSKSTVVGRVELGGLTLGNRVEIQRLYRIGPKVFVEYGLRGNIGLAINYYRVAFAVIDKTFSPVEFIKLPFAP